MALYNVNLCFTSRISEACHAWLIDSICFIWHTTHMPLGLLGFSFSFSCVWLMQILSCWFSGHGKQIFWKQCPIQYVFLQVRELESNIWEKIFMTCIYIYYSPFVSFFPLSNTILAFIYTILHLFPFFPLKQYQNTLVLAATLITTTFVMWLALHNPIELCLMDKQMDFYK